jgi:hypothetical protein
MGSFVAPVTIYTNSPGQLEIELLVQGEVVE